MHPEDYMVVPLFSLMVDTQICEEWYSIVEDWGSQHRRNMLCLHDMEILKGGEVFHDCIPLYLCAVFENIYRIQVVVYEGNADGTEASGG